MPDNNKKFWDRAAGVYSLIQENVNSSYYKALTRLIAPSFRSADTVLEIGCGSGQLTQPLSPLVKKWIATDFSGRMIAQTRKRMSKASNVVCKHEDATGLTFCDAAFDVVVIANVLHVMPNPTLALQEIRRVLKPGGLLIAPTYIYDGNESRWWLRLLEMFGFRTYNKWTSREFEAIVSNEGFNIVSNIRVTTKTLTNSVLTANLL